jgi:phosphoribosylamine--glycine ligase
MKILIIGNGGREHCIARKIFESKFFKFNGGELYCATGSPGINEFSKPVFISVDDVYQLANFAEKEKIDFTIVGPEIPLALGITDEFNKRGLKIFGPSQKAAEIESSKIFAKNLMKKYNIPTAEFRYFTETNIRDAYEYLQETSYPVVIKADGLAAGKGVIIAEDRIHAVETIDSFIEEKIFGKAGEGFIIEKFMFGYEVSLFAITDGDNYILLPSSQDHKRIGEGDTGKNTGGMGAFSPLPDELFDEELKRAVEKKIIKPVLKAMKEEGRKYKGCLYAGLMIVKESGKKKPYVVEFNCRFGDPETQAVVPLIKSDFLEMLKASVEGNIDKYTLETHNKYSCCVVMSSKGYPGNFQKGNIISGIEKAEEKAQVCHSGTKYDEAGNIITNGGRVLAVTALSSSSHKLANKKCYEAVSEIHFSDSYFRRDIGKKILKKK